MGGETGNGSFALAERLLSLLTPSLFDAVHTGLESRWPVNGCAHFCDSFYMEPESSQHHEP